MDHLYVDKDGKSEQCNCFLGIDHHDAADELSQGGRMHYTRLTMFHEWELVKKADSIDVFPVWLKEAEKNALIAHWEKTGMFPSIIDKVRAAITTKGIQ